MAPVLEDGQEIILNGRRYVFRLSPPNCAGMRHYHDEPHAPDSLSAVYKPDASDLRAPHHHHGPRCADYPRQATLVPAWDAQPPHVHQFDTDWPCTCGACRHQIPGARAGKVIWRYHFPPDADHPDGYSFARTEPIPGGEPAPEAGTGT